MRVDILGVGLDNLTLASAVEEAQRLIRDERGGYVCTPNAELLWLCSHDAELRKIINHARLVLPDGVGDLMAAKMLHTPLSEKVAGVDFAAMLLKRMDGTIFLLGGKPGIAEKAAAKIKDCFPQVQIVGVADGYFKDDTEIRQSILNAEPDFLMVCLGMGKQERFMASLTGDKRIGLMAGLGGTIDVLAGTIKRSPAFFINHNIEWLYRLIRQPKRIGRIMRLPLFLGAVCIQRMKQHGQR